MSKIYVVDYAWMMICVTYLFTILDCEDAIVATSSLDSLRCSSKLHENEEEKK